MTSKKAVSKSEAKAPVEVSLTVETKTAEEAVKEEELVMEGGIEVELEKETVSPMTEEELRARGKELKIPAAHNMGLKKLAEKIAEKETEISKEVVAKQAAKEAPVESFTTVIINTSQNPILLKGERKEQNILLAPREIKSIRKDLLRELLRNKVVRYWFDKGIITSNADANETSANEAVAPEHLSQPIERHNGADVKASVTKFQKEGSVSINL